MNKSFLTSIIFFTLLPFLCYTSQPQTIVFVNPNNNSALTYQALDYQRLLQVNHELSQELQQAQQLTTDYQQSLQQILYRYSQLSSNNQRLSYDVYALHQELDVLRQQNIQLRKQPSKDGSTQTVSEEQTQSPQTSEKYKPNHAQQGYW